VGFAPQALLCPLHPQPRLAAEPLALLPATEPRQAQRLVQLAHPAHLLQALNKAPVDLLLLRQHLVKLVSSLR
jgi:hypothetical protein